MSTEIKKPFKRDQALNDATSGQLGETPRADDDIPDSIREVENSRQKAARRFLEMDDILIQLESPFTYCFFPQMCKLLFMS